MLQRPSLPHMPGPQTPTSPPHNSHPVPHPLSLASPSCHLCLTTHKLMAASIFTTCQSSTSTTTTPSLHTRSAHNANSPHVSPAMMPSQHGIHNTVHKTTTATNDHNNGDNNGAAVGMVVVRDSGMVAAGMAGMTRHSYYLRLYIFYLCNKWIEFLIILIK